MAEKRKGPMLTVEALSFYVPLFQQGDAAMGRLLTEKDLTIHERNRIQSEVMLMDLAVAKIVSIAAPLINREIMRIIKGSSVFYNRSDEVYNVLYTAGIDGMRKGLRRFDVEKMKSSSTNYLFQWITTYAKKELDALEAPFGVAPSRYKKFKKISAVRNKLSDTLGRPATNEEVLQFFHDGKADYVHMNGPLNKPEKFATNQNITLELVAEQESFEYRFHNVTTVDPTTSYYSSESEVYHDEPIFSETIFGSFLDYAKFNEKAYAVFMMETNVQHLPEGVADTVAAMSSAEQKKVLAAIKAVMRDPNGVFYTFLKENADSFDDFDIVGTLRMIESSGKKASSSQASLVF